MSMQAHCHTPIGWLELTQVSGQLSRVHLVPPPDQPLDATTPLLREAAHQLADYFLRKRTDFDLPLDLSSGTPFCRDVWRELLRIPYGHTTSYGTIAKKMNQPSAARAVGLANRNNPIAIIIPCHRVIGSDGDLQGYFYGTEIKRKLLSLENPEQFGFQRPLF